MVEKGRRTQPFFSIGVTTYNRPHLLKQALNSVLSQTFGDFEVIVGNDYQGEMLTQDSLGITDARLRIVNHPHNLQETGNMNALLALASGRYFTWLADDDLYEPSFLQSGYDVLERNEFPPVFFSSYRVIHGDLAPPPAPISQHSAYVLSGREFLESYFAGQVKIISAYGLFDTAALRRVVGGVETLCTAALALYVEYIFLVRCGLFEKILYSDAPLVLYRMHEGSWGCTNLELDQYYAAGQELIRRSGQVLQHPPLAADLTKLLLAISDRVIHDYAAKLGRRNVVQGNCGVRGIIRAILELLAETASLRRAFLEAGGSARVLTAMAFTWLGYKYSTLIIKIVVEHRLWPARRHD